MNPNLTKLCLRPNKQMGAVTTDLPGLRFLNARMAKGLSTKEAALQIGCAASLLGRIEKGSVYDASDSTLCRRAAQVYGVSEMWLYAGRAAPKRFWPAAEQAMP